LDDISRKTSARVAETVANAKVRPPGEVQLNRWSKITEVKRSRRLIGTCAVHDLIKLSGEVKWATRRDVAMGASPDMCRAIELTVAIEVIVCGKAGGDDSLRSSRTEAKFQDESRLQRGRLDTEEDAKVVVVVGAKVRIAAVDDTRDLWVN
jgi:hypothetical protein